MPDLNIVQYVLLLTVIAGITELISRVRAKDYWVALTIVVAALTGLVFGIFGIEGLNPVQGLAVGFAAPGALTALGMIGKKSTPTPSDPLTKA